MKKTKKCEEKLCEEETKTAPIEISAVKDTNLNWIIQQCTST